MIKVYKKSQLCQGLSNPCCCGGDDNRMSRATSGFLRQKGRSASARGCYCLCSRSPLPLVRDPSSKDLKSIGLGQGLVFILSWLIFALSVAPESRDLESNCELSFSFFSPERWFFLVELITTVTVVVTRQWWCQQLTFLGSMFHVLDAVLNTVCLSHHLVLITILPWRKRKSLKQVSRALGLSL